MLGTRRDWVERNPNTARALVAALMEAQRWIAASPENTRETARLPRQTRLAQYQGAIPHRPDAWRV